VGKFFFDYNRYDEARTLPRQVTASGADDYADAQYLLGLIGVLEAGDTTRQDDDWARKLSSLASSNFQQAVTLPQRGTSRASRTSAYLALARIAYTSASSTSRSSTTARCRTTRRATSTRCSSRAGRTSSRAT
jgi:hypothetical protein